MQFTIHQVVITKEDSLKINAMKDPYSHPKMIAHRYMETTDEAELAFKDGIYNKVAIIEADDLDDVFHIGNVGPEENITRLSPMHSISVNDIIEDENGTMHLVAPCGFNKLTLSETV